jgi:hypothetical protein
MIKYSLPINNLRSYKCPWRMTSVVLQFSDFDNSLINSKDIDCLKELKKFYLYIQSVEFDFVLVEFNVILS